MMPKIFNWKLDINHCLIINNYSLIKVKIKLNNLNKIIKLNYLNLINKLMINKLINKLLSITVFFSIQGDNIISEKLNVDEKI